MWVRVPECCTVDKTRDSDKIFVQKGWALQWWGSPGHHCYSTVADSEWGAIAPWCFLSPAHISPHSQTHTQQMSLRYSKTGPVGFLNPTSCHPQQSPNPNQNFINFHLDKYTLWLKFKWNFCFILSTSIPSFTPGTILLQAAAEPLSCSAQLQNPSCDAWKKPLTMSWLLMYWDCCLSCL